MKILVTGSSGSIGNAVLNLLKNTKHLVTAAYHSNQPQVIAKNILPIKTDLRDKNSCYKLVKGIDYIIHTAAFNKGAKIQNTNPADYLYPNIEMSANLLDASYKEQIPKSVYFSSSIGYPNRGTIPIMENEFFVGEPYENSVLGWSKRITEKLYELYSTKLPNPLNITVLRPSCVYGPFDRFDLDSANALQSIVYRVVNRLNPLEFWGDGEIIRDFIYSEDVANASLIALEKCQGYHYYNVGSSQQTLFKDLVKIICKIDDYKSPNIKYTGETNTAIKARILDTSKIANELGFIPKTSLITGLKRTINGYKNQ